MASASLPFPEPFNSCSARPVNAEDERIGNEGGKQGLLGSAIEPAVVSLMFPVHSHRAPVLSRPFDAAWPSETRRALYLRLYQYVAKPHVLFSSWPGRWRRVRGRVTESDLPVCTEGSSHRCDWLTVQARRINPHNNTSFTKEICSGLQLLYGYVCS